jgi:hypothetical protein
VQAEFTIKVARGAEVYLLNKKENRIQKNKTASSLQ